MGISYDHTVLKDLQDAAVEYLEMRRNIDDDHCVMAYLITTVPGKLSLWTSVEESELHWILAAKAVILESTDKRKHREFISRLKWVFKECQTHIFLPAIYIWKAKDKKLSE